MPVAIVHDSQTLMIAAVEDPCRRLGIEDWAKHEPPRSDRAAHAAWRGCSGWFEEKRRRIRSMVDEALRAS